MTSRLWIVFWLGAAAWAGPLEWSLAPSDFVRYERRKVTRKGGKETFGAGAILTVHGHDIRAGQYAPVAPKSIDLSAILGLRLPSDPPRPTKLRLAVYQVIPLRIRGTMEVSGNVIVASYTFSSRGQEERGLRFRMRGGKAQVRAVFDPGKGIVLSARVTIGYALRKIDFEVGEKPRLVAETWDIRLKSVHRARHKGFQTEVDTAIVRGVKHLRTLQNDDGTFKPHGNWKLGTTALAILTLAACDVPRDDPAVKKALDWMCARPPPRRTYARAVALMALDRAYAPPGELARARLKQVVTFKRDLPLERRSWCEKAAAALVKTAITGGSWSYPSRTGGGRFRAVVRYDSSNTQYAVLGLRAAARLGIRSPEKTWLGVINHFRVVREKEGKRGHILLQRQGQAIGTVAATPVAKVAGFRYGIRAPHAWGSMTSAGIASLAIARDQLRRMHSTKMSERGVEQMILGGWAWLDRNWAMDRNPKKPGASWYYYYLYSLERACILDGVKRVGGRDWYYEGAMQLLARQRKKGQWGGIADTCFALLFLKRATAPITPVR